MYYIAAVIPVFGIGNVTVTGTDDGTDAGTDDGTDDGAGVGVVYFFGDSFDNIPVPVPVPVAFSVADVAFGVADVVLDVALDVDVAAAASVVSVDVISESNDIFFSSTNSLTGIIRKKYNIITQTGIYTM